MTLWDHLRGKFPTTIWAVANFCRFLTTVTVTGRQGNREVPGDPCPPQVPGEARAARVVPPLGPSPTLALMMVQCRELFSWS